MFASVRVRLTALTVGIVVCLYVLSAGSIYGIVRRMVYRAMDKQLQTTITTIKTEGLQQGIKALPTDTYVIVEPVRSSPDTNAPPALEQAMERFVAAHPYRVVNTMWTGPAGTPYRILVAREPARGLVMVAVNVKREANVLHQLYTVLLAVGGVGFLTAFAGGFYLADRALRPVKAAWNRQLEFVADASHELRTPLAVVQSNLGVVMEHSAEFVADNLEWLNNAYSETRRMSKLIQDLLTLARSDAQASPIEKAPVSLSTVAQKVCDLYSVVVASKQQTLLCEIEPNVEITGDADRLHQLLVILLDNASKYTPEGGRIEVRLSRQRLYAVVSVTDTGVGIDQTDIPKIFGRFYRSNTVQQEGERGAGLGLSIAKWIVDAHAGSISVESERGRGTTFTITFPEHRG